MNYCRVKSDSLAYPHESFDSDHVAITPLPLEIYLMTESVTSNLNTIDFNRLITVPASLWNNSGKFPAFNLEYVIDIR